MFLVLFRKYGSPQLMNPLQGNTSNIANTFTYEEITLIRTYRFNLESFLISLTGIIATGLYLLFRRHNHKREKEHVEISNYSKNAL